MKSVGRGRGIDAGTADEDVVAGQAIERVGAGKAKDQVVLRRAVERNVVAGRADDDVERAAIGELDLFDVAQPVGAVQRVLDGVGDDDLPVRGGGEGILAAVALRTWPCRCPLPHRHPPS